MTRDSRRRISWLVLCGALALALPAQASLAPLGLAPAATIGAADDRPLEPPPTAELLDMLDEVGASLHDDYDVVPFAHVDVDPVDLDRLLDLASVTERTPDQTVTD